MLRLSTGQKVLLAEKLADGANLALAALVFGQAIGSARFSVGLALFGVLIWAVLLASAVRFVRERP